MWNKLLSQCIVQIAANNGKRYANMEQNDGYTSGCSVFNYAPANPKTGKHSTKAGLAFAQEQLNGINPDADEDGCVDDSEINEQDPDNPNLGDVMDFDGTGNITPQKQLAFDMFADAMGKGKNAMNGKITPEKMEAAKEMAKDNPEWTQQELQKISKGNHLDDMDVPSYY